MHIARLPLVLIFAMAIPAWGADFVAGTAPSQRPANAPTIKQHQITPDALGKRLHGVSDPLPTNVVDAAMAGAWFMPLAHPGMTYPYDLRGWHRANTPEASPLRAQ